MAAPKTPENQENSPEYLALDPRQIFDDRAAFNESKAHGVERFVYKIFGKSLIASIAFAIDPLAKFAKPLKTNRTFSRTRYRPHAPVSSSFYYIKRNRTRVNYYTPGSGWGGLIGNWGTIYDGSGYFGTQTRIDDFITDTTNRSRPKEDVGGPLELFKSTMNVPGFNRKQRSYSINTFGDGQASDSETLDTYTCYGPCAILDTASQNSLLTSERAYAQDLMSANLYSMMSKCLPRSPLFGLFRSIGELKDFAHVTHVEELRGRLERVLDSKAASVNPLQIVKESADYYLSIEFGLLPLLSDLQSLLALPARVAKKFNLLLSRSGKPTSWRTKKVFLSGNASPPTFNFLGDGLAYGQVIGSKFSRASELRMAINSTFEFPPAEIPKLSNSASELKLRLYGAEPSFKAIYDLMPWSWLIDWFTGFGSYLDILEQINSDPSLINYGFYTFASDCVLTSQCDRKYDNFESLWYRPSAAVNTIEHHAQTLTAEYRFRYQIRKSLAEFSVSSTEDPSTLTDFQKTIISGLLAQRIAR